MRVRRAVSGDLDRLLGLYAQLEGPYSGIEPLGRDEAERRFARMLDDGTQHTLVAEKDGEVVGTLVVTVLPNLAHGGAPYAVVENVVVQESRRGGGIGRSLMEEAVGLAREAGAYKLALSTNRERREAHEFYRSLGMKETHLGFEVRP